MRNAPRIVAAVLVLGAALLVSLLLAVWPWGFAIVLAGVVGLVIAGAIGAGSGKRSPTTEAPEVPGRSPSGAPRSGEG